MKKKFPFLRVFILMVVMMMGFTMTAGADSLQDKLNDLKDQVAQQTNKVNGIKTEKDKADAVLNSSKQQVKATESQIYSMINAVQAKEAEIETKQVELDLKKQEFEQAQSDFMQRLRAMYMMQTDGAVETVLGATSFSDFLATTDALKRISVADSEFMKQLEQQRLAIEQEQAVLDEELKQLEAQKAALEVKKTQYLQQVQTAEGEVAAKDEELKLSQAELNAILTAKAEIEKEIYGTIDEFVGGDWRWPVPGYSHISSGFGPRTYDGYHWGIDIAKGSNSSILGAPIVASNAGMVITSKYNAGGYGLYIIIDHGGNNFTVYGHCNQLLVSAGTYVQQGDVIATVGNTGNSTGPHLHFEIRINGVRVNPLSYLANRG